MGSVAVWCSNCVLNLTCHVLTSVMTCLWTKCKNRFCSLLAWPVRVSVTELGCPCVSRPCSCVSPSKLRAMNKGIGLISRVAENQEVKLSLTFGQSLHALLTQGTPCIAWGCFHNFICPATSLWKLWSTRTGECLTPWVGRCPLTQCSQLHLW